MSTKGERMAAACVLHPNPAQTKPDAYTQPAYTHAGYTQAVCLYAYAWLYAYAQRLRCLYAIQRNLAYSHVIAPIANRLLTCCIGLVPLSTIVCAPIVCADVPMYTCVTLLCFLFSYSGLGCLVFLPLLSVHVGCFWRSNLGLPNLYHALISSYL